MDFLIVTLAVLDGVAFASRVFMVAVGLTLIFGVLRIVNLAHGGFYAVSAYAASSVAIFIASFHSSLHWLIFPALLLLSIFIGVFLGGIIEKFVLRYIYVREEVLQLLVTFAIFMILEDMQRLIWGVNPYSNSMALDMLGTVDVFNIPYTTYQLIFMPAVALITLVSIRWFLRKTLQGNIITAVTEDRETAISIGINAQKIFFLTFCLGAVLACLGGAISAPTSSQQLGIGADMLVLSFAVIATAGLGQIEGTALVALLIGMGRSFAVYLMPEIDILVPYLIMVIVLLFRPQGIFGTASARKI